MIKNYWLEQAEAEEEQNVKYFRDMLFKPLRFPTGISDRYCESTTAVLLESQRLMNEVVAADKK